MVRVLSTFNYMGCPTHPLFISVEMIRVLVFTNNPILECNDNPTTEAHAFSYPPP